MRGWSGGSTVGLHPKNVGRRVTPEERKSWAEEGIGGKCWWEDDSREDTRSEEASSDVPLSTTSVWMVIVREKMHTYLGHLFGSSALASTATMTSTPRAFASRLPNGTCSRLEPPSTSESHCEPESEKLDVPTPRNG